MKQNCKEGLYRFNGELGIGRKVSCSPNLFTSCNIVDAVRYFIVRYIQSVYCKFRSTSSHIDRHLTAISSRTEARSRQLTRNHRESRYRQCLLPLGRAAAFHRMPPVVCTRLYGTHYRLTDFLTLFFKTLLSLRKFPVTQCFSHNVFFCKLIANI